MIKAEEEKIYFYMYYADLIGEITEECITEMWEYYQEHGYVDVRGKHQAFSRFKDKLDEIAHGQDNIPKLIQ